MGLFGKSDSENRDEMKENTENGIVDIKNVSRVIDQIKDDIGDIHRTADLVADITVSKQEVINDIFETLGIEDIEKIEDMTNKEMTVKDMAEELGISEAEMQEQLNALADISELVDLTTDATNNIFFGGWALINHGEFEDVQVYDEKGEFTQEFKDLISSAPGTNAEKVEQALEALKRIDQRSQVVAERSAEQEKDPEVKAEKQEHAAKGIDEEALQKTVGNITAAAGAEYEKIIDEVGPEGYILTSARDWSFRITDELSAALGEELPVGIEVAQSGFLTSLDQIESGEVSMDTFSGALNNYEIDIVVHLNDDEMKVDLHKGFEVFSHDITEYAEENNVKIKNEGPSEPAPEPDVAPENNHALPAPGANTP